MVKRRWIVYGGIWGAVVLLNAASWSSTAFSDAYIAHVFPIWVNLYGRVTGLVPFSVGEVMLGLAALLVGAAVLLFPASGLVWLTGKLRKNKSGEGAADFFLRCAGAYYRFLAWTLAVVCLVMTLNCFILYHGSTFSETYFGGAEENKQETGAGKAGDMQGYTFEEMLALRNYVVEQCNFLAGQMERDEEGNVVYHGDIGDKAVECMKELGKTYGQLDGFYPKPKPLYTSDFFSQQYMQGYYFPFSMEANYNDVMYIMNKPATMCHELSHLRGYIFEDEANFISYLACVQSEDEVFRYSGYLSVLNYLDNDFFRAVGRDREAYLAQPVISRQVSLDNVFVTQEEWDRINGKALIDTETVDKVSDALVDATLKANGVTDGLISYTRVVQLMLLYYRENGGIG